MADGATVPVGTAEVTITANLAPFEQGLNQARQATQQFQVAANQTANVVQGSFNRSINGSTQAASNFTQATQQSAVMTNVFNTSLARATLTARQFGTSVTQFQQVGQQMSQSIAQFNAAVTQFNQQLAQVGTQAGRAGQGTSTFRQNVTRAAGALGLVPGPAGAAASRIASLLIVMEGLSTRGIIIGATIGAVVAVFAKASTEAEKFERQMFRTEALLRATGNTAGLTAEQIFELSESIESATLASSDDVQRAAQRLIQFGETAGEEFERTLRLAQDLSASGFGDIVTSVEAIGLAFERPEQAIRRFRGVISEATLLEAQLLLDAGKEAEAHQLILESLADSVGGLGEAEAGGLTGAYHRLMDAASDAFRDIGIGTGIVDIQAESFDALTRTIQRVSNLYKGLPLETGLFPPVPETVQVTPVRRTKEEVRRDREAERQLAADRRAEIAENRRLREEAERLARERKELIASSDLEIQSLDQLIPKLLASGQASDEVTRQLQVEQQIRETLVRLKTSEAEAEGAAIAENMRQRAEQDRQLALSLRTREVRGGVEDSIAALEEEAAAFDMTAKEAAVAALRLDIFNAVQDGVEISAEDAENAVRRFGESFDRLEVRKQEEALRDFREVITDLGAETVLIGATEQQQMVARFRTELDKFIEAEERAGRSTELLRQNYDALVRSFGESANVNLTTQVLAQMTSAVDALNVELGVQARTMGLTEGAAAAYRIEQEALADAIRRTGFVSEDERGNIRSVAEEYGRVTQALADLEAQRRASEFLSGGLSDALEDIVFNAESLTDAFNNLAQAIAKAALEALLFGQGPLAGLGSTGAGGGLLGGLIQGGIGALAGGAEIPIPESVEVTPPVGLSGVDDAANAAALSASATALSASATGLTGSSSALTGSATGLTGAATGLTGAVTGLTGVATAFTGVTTALSTAAAALSGAAGALSAAAAALATVGTASAATDALSTTATAASVFHKGGMVGSSGSVIRFASPSLFVNAPRLHDGLRFDEFPAILQRGEEVISRDDARRGSRTVINAPINITMPPGADRREFRPVAAKLGSQLVRYLSEAQQRH